MDLPIQALILSLIGAVVTIRFTLSWMTMLAECFLFRGMSVSRASVRQVTSFLLLCWLLHPAWGPGLSICHDRSIALDVAGRSTRLMADPINSTVLILCFYLPLPLTAEGFWSQKRQMGR